MDITINPVECGPFLAANEQPTVIFDDSLPSERSSEFGVSVASRPGCWTVVNSVNDPKTGVSLNLPEEGSAKIRIPLFSYTTNGRSFETLIGTAIHLALSIAFNLIVDCRSEHHLKYIDHAHIAVGNVYENTLTDGKEGYQMWVGLAFHHSQKVS